MGQLGGPRVLYPPHLSLTSLFTSLGPGERVGGLRCSNAFEFRGTDETNTRISKREVPAIQAGPLADGVGAG